MPTNLYEGVDEFRLIDEDNVVIPEAFRIIKEPVGFGDLNIELKRDPKDGGGVNFEFGDGDTPLSFDPMSGKELIEQILDVTGSDSNISLEFYNDGILRYKGSIVASSLRRADDVVTFNVQRIDFGDKFRTRLEAEIDLEKTTNFDGGVIVPDLIDLILHSRLVRLEVESAYDPAMLEVFPVVPVTVGPTTFGSPPRFAISAISGDVQFYYLGGMVINKGGASEYFNYLNLMFASADIFANVIIDHPDTLPFFGEFDDSTPLENKIFILEQKERFAECTFEFDFDFEIRMPPQGNGGRTVQIFFDLIVEDDEDNIVSNTQLYDSGVLVFPSAIAGDPILIFDVQFTDTQTFDVIQGHKVYAYFRFEVSQAGNGAFILMFDFTTGEVNIRQDTYEIQSTTKGNFLPIIVDKALEYITGTPLALETSYFEHEGFNGATSDGCGGLDFITTGNSIRGFDKPVTVVLRDILDYIITRYGAGFAIYNDGGSEKLLIEKSSFFFQDKKIMTLERDENPPVKRINRDLLANQIQVGYEKFARTNEVGTIDGFNTQINYLTPIVKDKRKISYLSPVVGDGSEIERLRRQGIKEAGSQSDEKDDDIFVVRYIRINSSQRFSPALYGNDSQRMSVVRDNVNNRITINGLIILGLQVGDKIVQDGKTTVAITGNIDLDFENNFTRFSAPTVEDGEFFDDFHFTDAADADKEDVFYTERVENFSNITLEDPFSEYNIRHTPTQFLIHNFYLFGSTLIKKAGTALLQFLFRKNETILEKEFDSAACGLTTDLINENQDFELLDLRTYNPTLFTEYLFEVTTRMSFSDLIRMKEALRNESAEDINYGYVDFEDIDGSTVQIYPFSVKYNPVSEEVKVIGWEKNN